VFLAKTVISARSVIINQAKGKLKMS